MIYSDRVYGKIIINEPVIIDIINDRSLQRLKKIDQAGYFEPFYPGTKHTRFEHSLGVYFLLKKFKASLNEQITGLIHDISHAAFSHCVDYILAISTEKNQNHHDKIFKSFVEQTEIPNILRRYKIDVDYIFDEKNFLLEERQLPDLCADRLDYSLRTAVIFKEINQKRINYFLNNLVIINNYWVFKNLVPARRYAELFLKLNQKYYSGFYSAVMFRTVGDYLKYSLDKKYINKEDLYRTDDFVINKISKYLKNDKQLKIFWQRMNNKIKVINNPKDYTESVFIKSRVVDPLFVEKDKQYRLSDYDKKWKEIIKKELIPKQYFLNFN